MEHIWSTPCCDTSHLGKFSLKTRWCTVVTWGSFVELSRWFPGCGFNPMKSEHLTESEAKLKAEKWMEETA